MIQRKGGKDYPKIGSESNRKVDHGVYSKVKAMAETVDFTLKEMKRPWQL